MQKKDLERAFTLFVVIHNDWGLYVHWLAHHVTAEMLLGNTVKHGKVVI